MNLQVDIRFDQLVQLAKQLPAKQWAKLKEEVDQRQQPVTEVPELEAFLLTAPTFTPEQLDEVAKTRKAINQWRTK
jgi:hypothetical protein